MAWRSASESKKANETGVVALDGDGSIADAGWAEGVDAVIAWIERLATEDTLVCVDAPMVVRNERGQRRCETEVGRRYGRWKVSANSTNLHSPGLEGVRLLAALAAKGWSYDDGRSGPPAVGRYVMEVYPYTTLVGAPELGYEVERPIYKRRPRSLRTAEWRPVRARNCDELIARLGALDHAKPAMDLSSHDVTRTLRTEPSPEADVAYKHREDLIDAALCAWTGALWTTEGLDRCQLLGADDEGSPIATIVAPARPEQRPSAPIG